MLATEKRSLVGLVSEYFVCSFQILYTSFYGIIAIPGKITIKLSFIFAGNGSPYAATNDIVRKPTRLEALPNVENSRKNSRKRSNGPILNTMGTF